MEAPNRLIDQARAVMAKAQENARQARVEQRPCNPLECLDIWDMGDGDTGKSGGDPWTTEARKGVDRDE